MRWAIIDKASGEPVGTIELFHRDSKDAYDNCGLLRLDLRSDYEKAEYITDMLAGMIDSIYDMFWCDKIATKVKPFMKERGKAFKALGFKPCTEPLVGNEGETYSDYYLLKKA